MTVLISARVQSHGKPCPFCKRTMDLGDARLAPTRDHHPIPRSLKGTKTIMCCSQCNNIKGDMTGPEWEAFMASHPKWWESARGERHFERKERRERERTERWGPRGNRVIRRDPEKPSTPLADALAKHRLAAVAQIEQNREQAQQLSLTRAIARGFNETFRESDEG